MNRLTKFEAAMMGVVIVSSFVTGHQFGSHSDDNTIAALHNVIVQETARTRELSVLLAKREKELEKLLKVEAPKPVAVQVQPAGYAIAGTGIKTSHLRRAIKDVLTDHDVYSKGMEELLVRTAAIETANGNQLYQQNNGPAKGIFQMEPATEKTVLRWMKKNKKYAPMAQRANYADPLVYDLEYQIMTAAAYYNQRTKGKLPKHDDDDKLWVVYKKYWNTHLGATQRDFADMRVACLVSKPKAKV